MISRSLGFNLSTKVDSFLSDYISISTAFYVIVEIF